MQINDFQMLIADTAQQQNIPGLAAAITDHHRVLAVYNYGYANLESHTPVTDETRFEFGSIGKSFTAVALLQLVDAGLLDLHQPLAEYLPWFELPSDYEPITPHHLLSHTAGIMTGSEFSGEPWFEVYSLRETRPSTPPGTHFHYSNLGYKALGILLEMLTGQPYEQTIRERILHPLGMKQSTAWITHAQRRELATGYTPLYDDRPAPPDRPLATATWLESGTADGCIIATAADLAIYARMLLNGGMDGVLSQAAFQQMITPRIPTRDGGHYGYGLVTWEQEGRRYIGHSGGMVGYTAQMTLDPESGLAVTVLANHSSTELGALAHALLHRQRTGETRFIALPPAPDEELRACSGTFIDEADPAQQFSTQVRDGRLWMQFAGREFSLERRAPDIFVTDQQPFHLFSLVFCRDGDKVTHAVCGERSFRSAAAELAPPPYPAEWDALTGHYRSHNPWFSNFRVVIQRGELKFIYAEGFTLPLTPLADGSYRLGFLEQTPERLIFDRLLNGRMLRAKTGGQWYYRTFTP